ncbi:MAG: O-antigen polymerase [Burkholderiales bacterium]
MKPTEGTEPSAAKPAPYLGLLSTMAFCIAIPLWVVLATGDAGYPAWPWALVATVIAGARFAWVVASSRRRLFEMTTWLFFYLFLGVAPLVQLRDQIDPGTTLNLAHEYDWQALSIVIVSEIAIILGSSFGRAAGGYSHEKRPTRRVSAAGTRNLSVVLVLAAAAYIALIGVGTLFGSRAARDTAVGAFFGDPLLNVIISAFVSFGLLVAVVAQMQARRERFALDGKKPIVLLAVSIVLLLIIVNPIGSPRFVLMTVLLGILAGSGLFRRMAVYRGIALGSVAAMLLLFPILDTFRRTIDATVEAVDPLAALKDGDFDSYGQVVNTVWYVTGADFTWGNQMLGVLLFWVPRSLWADKPTDTGIMLAEQKGYWFTNLSAPLPAELFINAGWPAVIMGMFIFGYWIRRWDRRSELHIQQYGAPTVLGCVMPFYLLLLLRGSLLQATANVAVILICWLLVTTRREGLASTGRDMRADSRAPAYSAMEHRAP